MGVKSGQTAALDVGTSSNAAAYTLGCKGNRERKEERPERSDTSPYITHLPFDLLLHFPVGSPLFS